MTESDPQSLESYLQRRFDPVLEGEVPPVPDEAHVGWWREHHQARGGSASSLVEALAQFQIPIAEHASTSEAYARAIRGGQAIMDPQAAEAIFAAPGAVEWRVVDHAAGGLPVAQFGDRRDFERAFRALGNRCEPVPVGPNVHALYVGGLPNPVRLRAAQSDFLAEGRGTDAWPEEMRRRRAADATAFHDRLILLHPAPYAGLSASRVGLGEDEWLEASMGLRLEHEFTHHATHRLLGGYRLHVHDEVLADLMGFTAALGRFEASLFLEGLGIGKDGARADARVLTYTADLDPNRLPELIDLLRSVANSVESLSVAFVGADSAERVRRVLRLASYDLPTLAAGGVRASDLDASPTAERHVT